MNEERIVDVASAGVVVATMVGYLPTIAAALSIIWALIRIAETETAQMILYRFGLAWILPRNMKAAMDHTSPTDPMTKEKSNANEDKS